jgi:hypothetical protein
MKKINSIVVLLCCAVAGAIAQKQSDLLPYNKEKLDSLFRSLPKSNLPFALPVPKGPGAENHQSFEALHAGATVINTTARGTIYNMPLDNMAVLVPNMIQAEKMPGSGDFRQAPPANMPNSLNTPRKKR